MARVRIIRLAKAVPGTLRMLCNYGIPKRSLLFGSVSLGDDLLCTAVLREFARRGTPLAMISDHPDLFELNRDVVRVIPIHEYYLKTIERFRRPAIRPYYVREDAVHRDREVFPATHIIAEMCRRAGIMGDIEVRPHLTLSDRERQEGVLFPDQIAIQSTCLSASYPYPTKEWGVDRMIETARILGKKFSLVQLGTASDPRLPVAADLCGQTTLRGAAAVLAASRVFVGLEGFLVHLARSVDCPSVVVLGGRALPVVHDYSCNVNLHAQVDCSPCGLRTGCPHQMNCMRDIVPDRVVEGVVDLFYRRAERLLSVDRVSVG